MSQVLIQTHGLSKVYDRGSEQIVAVDKVDFELRAGDFVSFVGPSGSGKTTLLHLLGCLDTPSSGDLNVAGTPIFQNGKSLSERQLTGIRRDLFGYVFQKFYLIPTLTVKENILLPFAFHKRAENALDVLELAQRLGLSHRLTHLPKELSGGEMQRVAIARAMINQPKIILADEPTGNLDSKRSTEIADILADLNKSAGLTIILVTHNPQLAAKAGRIIELRDGRIV